jgi:hypothetical protein
MKVFLAIVMILLPLGVMATPAGNVSLSDLQGQWSALPLSGFQASQAFSRTVLKDLGPALVVAHSSADAPGKSEGVSGGEIDLRDVDWDKVKAGKKVAEIKNGNGENDEEEADEEREDEKEDEEEDEGRGSDRLWDCPKLG